MALLNVLRIIIILVKILVISLDVTKITVWKLHKNVLTEDIHRLKIIIDEIYFILMAIFIVILFHGVFLGRQKELRLHREDAILIVIFTLIIVFNSLVNVFVPHPNNNNA
jgi:hypothetical protein